MASKRNKKVLPVVRISDNAPFLSAGPGISFNPILLPWAPIKSETASGVAAAITTVGNAIRRIYFNTKITPPTVTASMLGEVRSITCSSD